MYFCGCRCSKRKWIIINYNKPINILETLSPGHPSHTLQQTGSKSAVSPARSSSPTRSRRSHCPQSSLAQKSTFKSESRESDFPIGGIFPTSQWPQALGQARIFCVIFQLVRVAEAAFRLIHPEQSCASVPESLPLSHLFSKRLSLRIESNEQKSLIKSSPVPRGEGVSCHS
jgi:hypothetical protein